MIYEQHSRNLWFSRIVGVVYVATLVFIVFGVVVVIFGGDVFWFALTLAVLVALVVLGYLKSDRWVLGRFDSQFIMPPRQAREALEEMAIAAGIPTPILYVIDTGTLNAFALGREPSCGIVIVTKGLLDDLDGDELRGVLAHEVAHITNGDSMAGGLIALMAWSANRLSALGAGLFGFLIVSGGLQMDPQVATALLTCVLCWVLPVCARTSQVLFGRSRELLADNASVFLTRNPEAMIGALSKLDERSSVVVRAGLATSHLFIASPRPWWNSDVISTHPPIAKRIDRLRHTTAVPIATDTV